MADESVAGAFYIYVHSRWSTGEPFYVGKGRWGRVLTIAGRSAHWKRIVAKDGGRYVNVIAETTDEDLVFLIECELIDKYRRTGVDLINKTDGGEGCSGYKLTADQLVKWSEVRRGNKYNLGRKHSEETRAKMRAAQQARTVWPKLTDEHKKKIGAASVGRKNNLGKKASAETRAKLSAFQKGKQHTLGHKLTEEHKAKVSASLMGNKRNLGNKASDEARANMSIAQKAMIGNKRNRGNKASQETKLNMSIAQKAAHARRRAKKLD